MVLTKMDKIIGVTLTLLFKYGIKGYVYDTQIRPKKVLEEARAYARTVGKPFLNAGCGKTCYGDVNLDKVPQDVPNFVLGDIENMYMFTDKQFGAVFASHVLEHTENPDKALEEMHRVAEKVFIVTPHPIFFHTYLNPDHKWLFIGKKRFRLRK